MTITRRSLLIAAAVLPSILGSTPAPDSPPPRPRAPALVNIYSTSRLPLGVSTTKFVDVMQRYVDDFLAPVWGTPARLQWTSDAVNGAMNLRFMEHANDDSDTTIAYHAFDPTDPASLPYGEIDVFNSYTSSYGNLSVPFSHELAEMLVNPGVNNWAGSWPTKAVPEPLLSLLEVCDPVERTWFHIDGVPVSNFVYPAYFQPFSDGPLDFLGATKTPGELLDGGYQLVRSGPKVVSVYPELPKATCYRAQQALRSQP